MHTPIATAFLISTVLALPGVEPQPAAAAASTQAAANYELKAAGPSTLALGGAGTVKVEIKPTGGWHMNLDFPTSLSLTAADGLSVAKGKLKKGSAKRLDESGLVFEVPVTAASAGSHTLEGTLKFALCRDEACAPVKEAIKVKVAVK